MFFLSKSLILNLLSDSKVQESIIQIIIDEEIRKIIREQKTKEDKLRELFISYILVSKIRDMMSSTR